MSTAYYTPRMVLLEDREEERRFWKIAGVSLIVAALFGAIVPFIKLPEVEREKQEVVPPRLAKLILEKKPPPPPPKVEVVKPKPKPKVKPKPVVEPAPRVKPKPKPEPVVIKRAPPKVSKPATDREARAREKARSTGLLAMSDEFSELMDTPAASELLTQRVTKKSSATKAAAPAVDTSILTANAGKGSDGVKTGKLNREVGSTRLQQQQQSKLAKRAEQEAEKKKTRRRSTGRGVGEIQRVFDKNRGAIFAIYNRALRRDPELQGKLVLKITIAPSGKVTAVKVVSSELNNKSLETKLVRRIKLFNFGRKQVDTVTVTYPIDFFPAY